MAKRPDNLDLPQIGAHFPLGSPPSSPSSSRAVGADDKSNDSPRPGSGSGGGDGIRDVSTGGNLSPGETALLERVDCCVFDFKNTSSEVSSEVKWLNQTCKLSDMIDSNSILKDLDDKFQKFLTGEFQNSPDTNQNAAFRWIHIPANNSKWAKLVNGKVRAHLDRFRAKYEAHGSFCDKNFFIHRANASKTKKSQFHAIFMKPYCERWEELLTVPARSEIVFLMPYLHWERFPHYEKMRRLVQKLEGKVEPEEVADLQASSSFPKLEEQLIKEYLPDHHLQIRRSLDQSYYSTIADTADRDGDQVVDRYARDFLEKSGADRPLLMVDQLWLWVLDENTIISSFPHTLAHLQPRTGPKPYNDPLDVHEQIVEYLKLDDKRVQFDTALKVAFLIIHRCAGNIVDEKLVDQSELQFIEYFDRSIDILMNKQRKCLQNLEEAIKETSKEYLDKPHKRSPDPSKSSETTKLLNFAKPFDIEEEFLILKEIRDITEEIHMLLNIVEHQQDALEALSDQYLAHSSNDGVKSLSLPGRTSTHAGQSEGHRDNQDMFGHIASPVGEKGAATKVDPETRKTLGQLIQRSAIRKQILTKLHDKAQHVDRYIVRQLDLKQKSASTLSADRMVRIAQESEKQSDSIMLFTVVTILFLPLSSIAGIFGMNAKEFGQGQIHLSHLFIILFPVSLACIVVTFLLAFHERLRNILLLSFQIPWALFLKVFPSLDSIETGMRKKLENINKAELKKEEKLEKSQPKGGETKKKEEVRNGKKKEEEKEDPANRGEGMMVPNGPTAAPNPAAPQTPPPNEQVTVSGAAPAGSQTDPHSPAGVPIISIPQATRRSLDLEAGGIPKA